MLVVPAAARFFLTILTVMMVPPWLAHGGLGWLKVGVPAMRVIRAKSLIPSGLSLQVASVDWWHGWLDGG